MKNIPAALLCDFYKLSHRTMFPEGTQYLYETFTPRKSRIEGVTSVVAFGFQGFIKKYLIEYFNENFFNKDFHEIKEEYERVLKFCLGVENPDATHLKELHDLGNLPLRIRAVEEGTEVPMRVPVLTIENTHPDFAWLVGFFETLMSAEIWMPMTSATISLQYKRILTRYAEETSDIPDFVQFQGHDFSMRGMSCIEAAMSSGCGHLTSFCGTDTIPAILYAEQYYNANIEKELVGVSCAASEHSVMEANGMDEYKTHKYLLTEKYPTGILSLVGDTWNLWNVLTDVLPRLKNEIMARDGKYVCRPDSGSPVLILCGNPDGEHDAEKKGVIELLWDVFGGAVNSKGYKQLDPHVGAIYGDAITPERAEEICARLKEKGFASTNVVLGIGSYTFQYKTRDTFGFALKATSVTIDGVEHKIFKDPVTDKDKFKKSQLGRVVVLRDSEGVINYVDNLSFLDTKFYEDDLLELVFLNGMLMKETSLAEVRARLK